MRKIIITTAVAALMAAPAFAQSYFGYGNYSISSAENSSTTNGSLSTAGVSGGSPYFGTGAVAEDVGVAGNYSASYNGSTSSSEGGLAGSENVADGQASPGAGFTAGGTSESAGATADSNGFSGNFETYPYYYGYGY